MVKYIQCHRCNEDGKKPNACNCGSELTIPDYAALKQSHAELLKELRFARYTFIDNHLDGAFRMARINKAIAKAEALQEGR